MEHPFYVRQTAEPDHNRTPEDRIAWMERAWKEAQAQGAKWPRFSIRESPMPMMLVECWAERPTEEGLQRWALQ